MAKNDLLSIYKTSVDMMKHFNSLLDKVRIIVVSTGLTVFASAGTTYLKNKILWIPLSISILGFLLILSMWFLAHHYIIHTESIAEGARELENRLFEETKVEVENGAFHKIHSDHVKRKKFKFAHDYSTFIVMLLGCLVVFVMLLIKS